MIRAESVSVKVTSPVESIEPVAFPGVSWVRKIVTEVCVAVEWYELRLRVASVMSPVVELTWPVMEPGRGNVAGGVPCTPNCPEVMASVTDVVAAEAAVADSPTNEPVARAVASRPTAPRRTNDRRPRPPVVVGVELGAGRSAAGAAPPPEKLRTFSQRSAATRIDRHPLYRRLVHVGPLVRPYRPTPRCSAWGNGNHGFPFKSRQVPRFSLVTSIDWAVCSLRPATSTTGDEPVVDVASCRQSDMATMVAVWASAVPALVASPNWNTWPLLAVSQ